MPQFRKKEVKRKDTKKKSLGETLAQRKEKLWSLESLLTELRLEYKYDDKNYLRINSDNFEEIFKLIKDNITKENTEMREPIPLR